MVRHLLNGLLAVSAAVLLAACGGSAGQESGAQAGSAGCGEPRPVALAVPAKSINFLPYYYGLDHGIFEQHCIDLQVEVLRGDAALAGVIRGDLDLTAAGGTAMRAAAEGAPVRAIMITVDQFTATLMAKPEIDGLEDLRGQDVATLGTGDSLSVSMFEHLQDNGLNPERDLNLLTVNATKDAYSALIGGSVDAAVLTPPYDAQVARDGFHPLIDFGEIAEGSQGQVAASLETIESKPDVLSDFIAAARDTVAALGGGRDAGEPTDEVVQYVATLYELDETIARDSLRRILPAYSPDGMASDDALLSQLAEGSSTDQLRQVVDFSIAEKVGQ